jgi:hypothetical protein
MWTVFTMNNHPPIRAEETAFERHYTPQQLAELWLLHESTIRRLFLDEPGVLKYGNSYSRSGRREYVTLRIPESVARRVYARKSR